jgi:hydroxyquinol 1,2-dioxygenase
MRDLNDQTITDAVIAKIARGGSPRGRQISEAVVRHLHALCRELELTEAEWTQAIDFLTRTGQMCSSTRQEFILLSDVLGVSMLVDAINHREADGATDTTVFGPFYVEAAPVVASGADISGSLEGDDLLIAGSVSDAQGNPIPGATVDIWHADADGKYDVQIDSTRLGGRGRVVTGEGGRFHVWSVVPTHYPIPDDGPVGEMLRAQGRHPYRPAHVHFMVRAEGHRPLVTHLFLEGSEYLDSDVVFGVKESLITPLEPMSAGFLPTGEWRGPYQLLRADLRVSPDRSPKTQHINSGARG